MTTPISDVVIALPVVIGGMLTGIGTTVAGVLWITSQLRGVIDSIADLRGDLHGVSERVARCEVEIGHLVREAAE